MKTFLLSLFTLMSATAMAGSDHADEAPAKSENVEVIPAKFVDLPAKCFPKKFPCALTFSTEGQVQFFDVKVAVTKGTSILLRANEMELLEGSIWSEEFEDVKIRHGIIAATLTGDVLVEKDDDQLLIINLNGAAEVKGGRQTAEPIPSGFQNWYRGLGQRGEFVQGMIEPFNPDFLPTWVTLSGLRGEEAKEKVAIYAANRKQAVEESSKLYRDILQMRRLASESQDRLAQVEQRKREQERSHFRKMMQDRLYRPD